MIRNNWILCSKSVPPGAGDYWVTYRGGYVDLDFWTRKKWFGEMNSNLKVIAWKPGPRFWPTSWHVRPPAPYKGGI